jgi:actin-related protein 2
MSKAIVCDNGSGFLKLGWSGENFPSFTLPSIIGRPLLRAEEKIGDIELKEVMIADEANPYRSMLEINYATKEGIVDNWDDMELIWKYAFFDKMKVTDPSDKKIIMTEAALNPKKNREKMAEIIFEKFNFGFFKCEMQALLSLMGEVSSISNNIFRVELVESFLIQEMESPIVYRYLKVSFYHIK